jgi:MarR family transcriptional regulator for hemolysin
MPQARHLQERALTADLLRLARVYRREVNRALARHGLSDAKALPVLHIARLGEGVRQGALAEELGIEGPSLVQLLDQLCAAGLVERRPHPQDGRAKTLHLSDEGRALAGVVEQAVEDLRHRLLAEVSDADLGAALRVMAALDKALHAAESQARAAG